MSTNDTDSSETVLQNEEVIRFLDIFNDSDDEEFEGFNVEEIDINQVVPTLVSSLQIMTHLTNLIGRMTKSSDLQMPE